MKPIFRRVLFSSDFAWNNVVKLSPNVFDSDTLKRLCQKRLCASYCEAVSCTKEREVRTTSLRYLWTFQYELELKSIRESSDRKNLQKRKKTHGCCTLMVRIFEHKSVMSSQYRISDEPFFLRTCFWNEPFFWNFSRGDGIGRRKMTKMQGSSSATIGKKPPCLLRGVLGWPGRGE